MAHVVGHPENPEVLIRKEGKIIVNLSNILPDIIFYIVVGFFFINVFHFTALRKNSSDIEHVLTGSLVSGYIICNLMGLIPISFGKIWDSIGITITAIVLGYFLGLPFQYNQLIYKLCDFFHLRNSINDYIWDDLTDWNYPNRLSVYYPDRIISGYVHYTENYSNTPTVTLAGYLVTSLDESQVFIDKTASMNQVIFVDLSKATYVEVIYDNRSSMCNEIKDLVNNNNVSNSNP